LIDFLHIGVDFRSGSATAMITNPIWVVQTTQAVESMKQDQEPSTSTKAVRMKRLTMFATIQKILAEEGIAAFWRGIGPALVLVVNPVIQYTIFEQLKNLLVTRREARLRASGGGVAALNELDFFFLGALSKLCELFSCASSFIQLLIAL
jgi:solute carrier family 25 (peroxisomal adenine nucleotide transporter), member 17